MEGRRGEKEEEGNGEGRMKNGGRRTGEEEREQEKGRR